MSSAQGQKLTVFRPPQVSGLVAWFDASDPSSVQGNPVTQWTDKSGVGNSATATTGPAYTRDPQGRPCMSFTGTQWFESTATVPATTHSLIAVHAPTYTNGSNGSGGALGGNSSLFRFQTGANYIVFPYYANGPHGYITSFGLGVGDTTLVDNSVAGTASIINANIAPTVQYTYKNGTQQATEATTLTSGTSPALTIGRYSAGLNEYYQGYVYEMIVYSTNLTTTQRQSIEGYLGWKWGLQASLSNVHPYLTLNPETPVYPLYPFTVPNFGTTTSIFTPTQVPGCAFWFDGADQSSMSFSSSSNLTQWRDKSGNAYNATASGSPGLIGFGTVNPGGVYFNGTTAYLSNFACPINLSQRAVFIVTQEVTHAGARGVLSFAPNPTTGVDYSSVTGMSIETSNGLRFYANSGAYVSDMGNVTLLPKSTYFDSMTGTQGGSYLNGTNTSNNVPNFTQGTCTGFVLGARWGGSGSPGIDSYGNIIINEIIVYSNPITTAQRQAVEAYLSVKWGTGTLLASSNIYNQKTLNSFGLAAVVPIPVMRPAQNAKWLPTQILGLVEWFDAADTKAVITSGSTVTQWLDKSGNNNNTSGSGGTITYNATFLNKKSGVTFAGNSSYLTCPLVVQTDWSIFILLTTTSSGGAGPNWWAGYGLYDAEVPEVRLDYGTSVINGAFATGIGELTGITDYTATTPTLINTGAPFICEFLRVSSTGQINVFLNGGLQVSAIAPTGVRTQASNPVYIGAIADNVANSFVGTMYEILVYNSSITDAQRANVEGYLAWKWGIVSSLPANHPFKLFPPPPQ